MSPWLQTLIFIVATLVWVWFILTRRMVLYRHADMAFEMIVERPTRVSVAHPKWLSKRVSSKVLVNMYIPKVREAVRNALRREFDGKDYDEHIMDANLPQSSTVLVALYCPGIHFSDPIKTTLEDDHTPMAFVARPEDSSHHGENQVKISVTNPDSSEEYFSATFPVRIADFAFDHVSHPLLMTTIAISMIVGAVTSFVLTYFQTIGLALGLTSGTVGVLLGSTIYGRLYWTFRRNVSQKVESNDQISLQQIFAERITMGDVYKAGQAAAMGPNAQASHNTFQQIWHNSSNTIDLPTLAVELSRLCDAMRAEGSDPQHDIAAAQVAAAEKAARDGDGPKTLEYLKQAGAWALGVAEKIGVGVAVAALKTSLEL